MWFISVIHDRVYFKSTTVTICFYLTSFYSSMPERKTSFPILYWSLFPLLPLLHPTYHSSFQYEIMVVWPMGFCAWMRALSPYVPTAQHHIVWIIHYKTEWWFQLFRPCLPSWRVPQCVTGTQILKRHSPSRESASIFWSTCCGSTALQPSWKNSFWKWSVGL